VIASGRPAVSDSGKVRKLAMSHAKSECLLFLYDSEEGNSKNGQTNAKDSMAMAIEVLRFKNVIELKYHDNSDLDAKLNVIKDVPFSHAVIVKWTGASEDLIGGKTGSNGPPVLIQAPSQQGDPNSLTKLKEKVSGIQNVVQFCGQNVTPTDESLPHRNIRSFTEAEWRSPGNLEFESDFLVMLQLAFGPSRQANEIDPSDLVNKIWSGLTSGLSGTVASLLEPSLKNAIIDEIGTNSSAHDMLWTLASSVFENNNEYFTSGGKKCLSIYNLLKAMTMARRLCSYTLEGENFNLWIELNRNTTNTWKNSQITNSDLLFEFGNNVFFCISDEKSVREIAELAIGDGIKLVVDWTTNKITSVRWFDRSPTNNSSLFLHVRSDERVDVLDHELNKHLEWDGFQWKGNQIQKLKNQLEEDGICDTEFRAKICEAAKMLLEGGYSSIILILAEEDMTSFGKVTDKPLRSQLLPPSGWFNSFKFADLKAEQVVSVLKLDGAHIISNDGVLFSICRNLIAKQGHWHNTHLTHAFGAIQLESCSITNGILVLDISETGSLTISSTSSSNNSEEFFSHLRDFFVDEKVELEIRRLSMASLAVVRGVVGTLTIDFLSTRGLSYNDLHNHPFHHEENPMECNFQLVKPSFFVTIRIGATNQVNNCPSVDGCYFHYCHKEKVLKCFVDILKIGSVRDGLKGVKNGFKYCDTIDQSLAEWVRCGNTTGAGNSGTGTRAAREASKTLPNSLVIKISASGAIKIFKDGVEKV
jgi:hypothetical protein